MTAGIPETIADQPENPLWHGWRQIRAELCTDSPLAALNEQARQSGITNALLSPIEFSDQTQPMGQRAYEAQIYNTGLVPTRAANLHDFYNACAWLTFPALKSALNAIHAHQIPSTQRSSASDAATLFDESGAVLIGPDPSLAKHMMAHDWQTAFIHKRSCWKDHHLIIVGHAALEKLHAPYPSMIVKAIYQPWPATDPKDLDSAPQGLDQALATRWLNGEFVRPADLFPIPLMGIPNAVAQNSDPDYYNDLNVFRPKRKPLGAKDQDRINNQA